MVSKILVAEDDYSTSKMVSTALKTAGYEATVARSFRQAKQHLRANQFDLVLSDLYLGDGTGLELLRLIRQHSASLPFLMITGKGSVETAVDAMQEGAFDFLAKPFGVKDLLRLVERALATRERSRIVDEVDSGTVESSLMIGTSPVMVEVYKKIALAAPTDTPVLVVGETGTGKELVARCLHGFSPRKDRSFVSVNCGALTETLLESELFGHTRGSFTGATDSREGLFAVSSGGTILLDEISETSPAFQVKLLRVLQEGEVRPVGSNRMVRVDTRVVASTNANLKKQIEERRFRRDLYYRLGVIQIELPPLRRRLQDVPLLVGHFLSRVSAKLNRDIQITDPAMELLTSYDWPGNVRELENVLERTAVLTTDPLIAADDLDFLTPAPDPASEMELDLSELQTVERDKIVSVLSETQGNRTEAARRLGIERKTLYRKAQRLGIDLNASSNK